ncbi:MAG TPA: hypothetical protein VJU87_12050 [Gemmatimonadaceae bacterium]|nr:hypothetical protein [Gemmatimonadaceae bacterium]
MALVHLSARAPARLDFGGGWTDVPPYADREGGFVCNVAIARYSTALVAPAIRTPDAGVLVSERSADRALVDAAVRRAGLHGVEVFLYNDFPVGAGLGGSSAAGVALAAALSAVVNGHALRGDRERQALAERSRATEVEELGVAGGRQDHYAAALGGALALRFSQTATVARRIPLSASVRAELERRCLLVYTGESRISGETIGAVLGAYQAGDRRVLAALGRMKALAEEMACALERGDLDALAACIGEHWVHQRTLHPGIPTPRIDAIVEQARHAGARGAKALGASGGGCVLVLASGENVDRVRRAIAPLGPMLPFTIAERGVEVERATEEPQS